MNFELSDEQVFLREAARDALGRVKTVEAARAALEGEPLPDLWPTASQAGWTGLLIGEENGGAGLGALDAMLVALEAGRVLAGVALLGHLPATALLDADGQHPKLLAALAAGEERAAFVALRPGDDRDPAWTAEPRSGKRRAAAPSVGPLADGADEGGRYDATVSGTVAWVPNAPGAGTLVVAALDGDEPVALLVDAIRDGAPVDGVAVEPVSAYDATRSLGHVTLDGARARRLEVDAGELANAWYLAHALIAAESLGTVEEALARSLEYAKERYTFGRPIGSYQAVKHALTEVLRRQENTRSLLYYAGWARQDAPAEFAVAASAARSSAGAALDFAARELISVHGGIGATWEHDAPLFFRRAQLSRRLLGGTGDATDRVAGELLSVRG
ncbi:acyl-CoA dehydrogenase family protein [Conexibacter sp. JD483]|uniref:acyl-CoA dehydrogenase family protein n=1 Tax=unclassified Conexibacter TaxID=2627773 RepID=UPI00272104A9|nr:MULTISPECIES: acyl-CoA dehydrogenase family protein [unclassified Conexibacter]MDO8189326.1 acyl-CoA dehydrogenase family protein [Conexibacter sp. CPCC 205706]MDO8201609.1 acyl-CoA dehydrogenase family protein [Conexibacter sp. CPCC 205762]MDR9372333.1 acyl-CoA dehydrogenase family protein [Conexibacter sp. JD483]